MIDSPFVWDSYSDQPHIIKDKQYKKNMRKKHIGDYIKMGLTNLFLYPFSIATMKIFKPHYPAIDSRFYGLGVNLDKGDTQVELIEELGVKSLAIRVPLCDIDNLTKYKEFAKSFGDDKDILFVIIQSRETIDNHTLLEKYISKVFDTLGDISTLFQIATTINRAKWGFFSTSEYLSFYQTVQKVRDNAYPTIKLLGPSVIDFEYYYTIRALFNNYNLSYDIVSSLLYVDRRGSPYNTQMGIFDFHNKIDMLYSLIKLSPKVNSSKIYITETNWPLSGTAPYAPTSEKECVSEELYAKYMVEYFDIAKQSGKIDRIYWHQLIAPGYGLVDNRDGKIRKTIAFDKFKEMIASSGIKGK